MVNFGWSIGITVTVSTFVAQLPYIFNTVQSASLRWTSIIGGHIGYAFGYWFNGFRYHQPWRTASGFDIEYFQPTWIARDGVPAIFYTQVAVVVAVLILTITPVIVIGVGKPRSLLPTQDQFEILAHVIRPFCDNRHCNCH
ncbi:uncharacterized protein BDW43DRAFT_306808 [Aspergillus alliaceus]|uniref:uncharacterized protein n=1 Tax=Petromyces alliaceus TaxID=209559 RepID=UPI0012A5586C|nr:uncharacterized protein BDW43DRAFT_306808 [Aspergillus alliaceus]KAB8238112.1 hypothetical protein BDW43DRAFT_306808 [Aspergillus alliaceus]